MDDRKLYGMLQLPTPETILSEVMQILKLIDPDYPVEPVVSAYTATGELYTGQYPGYRACNTGYHNLQHSLETFLTTSRLLHGAVLEGKNIPPDLMTTSLIAALFHDAGYIQQIHDTEGTGAKYTPVHVPRSIDFFTVYCNHAGMSPDAVEAGRIMIQCTDIAGTHDDISFPSPMVEFMGKMLNVADLWAQMADRSYLEKLLFLYEEFREAEIDVYQNEIELLESTISFFQMIYNRYHTSFQQADRLMKRHFEYRYQTPENLYLLSIQRHHLYLNQIMQHSKANLLDHLRRSEMVQKFRRKNT